MMRTYRLIFVFCSLLCLTAVSACGSKEEAVLEQHSNHTSAAEDAASESKKTPSMEESSSEKAEKTPVAGQETDIQKNVDLPDENESVQQQPDNPSSEKTDNKKKDGQSPAKEAVPAPDASEQSVKVHIVEIVDFAFSPGKLEIHAGDRVKFINRDKVKHSATANGKSFDTGLLGQDEGKEVTFAEDGEFTYYCMPHPAMKGTIIVKEK